MSRCLHKNVQQFTEMCLDCGRNIYESDESYLRYLIQLKDQRQQRSRSTLIEELERELGIEHSGNKPTNVYDPAYDY